MGVAAQGVDDVGVDEYGGILIPKTIGSEVAVLGEQEQEVVERHVDEDLDEKYSIELEESRRPDEDD